MPKSSSTQGSLIYQKIKRDIIFGELKPGEKLKVDTMKDRYNTSLPTLRETLNRLSSEEHREIFKAAIARDSTIAKELLKIPILNGLTHTITRMK